jgi:MoaA/NifB/PqqE/SkfB family radical SAM enzyme
MGLNPTIVGRAARDGGVARPLEVDLRLVSGSGARLAWRWATGDSRQPPARTAVVRAAESLAGRPGSILLGGDALQRADLLALLGDLARIRPERLGICTFGDGINVEAARRLAAAGLRRVQVPLHCARQDAHDWLVRRPGALKSARRAIRAFVEAGVPVTAEVVVTRPTAPHLAETVEVLARIGVRSVCLRRLTQADVDVTEFVPLSPRLELLGASLEKAAAIALERRMRMVLRDLPICVAPRLRPLFAPRDSEVWVDVAAATELRSPTAPPSGCVACPGEPHCAGAPLDYVARFGWEEFYDPSDLALRMQEDVEEQQALRPTVPMVFSWRGPRRLRCDACAGGVAAADGATPEPTRGIRSRMVQAARYRPQVLRLVGADLLAHPAAAQLIYDAVRLFPRVEVAGEASPAVDWSDLDLRRLKDLARFDVALYGPEAAAHDAHSGIPGAFAATMRAVARLRDAKIGVGAYAILHDAAAARGFVEAWAAGELPGEPRFRLSSSGGSLDELMELARTLPAGAGRDALSAVLPRCAAVDAGGPGSGAPLAVVAARQQIIDCGRSVSYRPCGSDPIGAFESCREGEEICAVPGCPGVARGWRSTARSRQWANT